eukprot:snap_masked-scaffold_8-processed-gene-6.21-mRNA-1 protein AED:1.00 eAED:1.00 QI:0/0/0/0/1/1/2/0/238
MKFKVLLSFVISLACANYCTQEEEQFAIETLAQVGTWPFVYIYQIKCVPEYYLEAVGRGQFNGLSWLDFEFFNAEHISPYAFATRHSCDKMPGSLYGTCTFSKITLHLRSSITLPAGLLGADKLPNLLYLNLYGAVDKEMYISESLLAGNELRMRTLTLGVLRVANKEVFMRLVRAAQNVERLFFSDVGLVASDFPDSIELNMGKNPQLFCLENIEDFRRRVGIPDGVGIGGDLTQEC